MSNKISELTYKIAAFGDVQDIDVNECIDWAIEMLELGHESPSLLIVASFSKPVNYFEIMDYLKAAIDELGLEMKTGKSAIMSYAGYYMNKILTRKNLRSNLTELYKIYINEDIDELRPFYMLFWAWDSLDYDDNGINHYWKGVTRSNIENIIVVESEKWIIQNKKHYAQQQA